MRQIMNSYIVILDEIVKVFIGENALLLFHVAAEIKVLAVAELEAGLNLSCLHLVRRHFLNHSQIIACVVAIPLA